MLFKNIPQTGLTVSQICLGTAEMGSVLPKEAAFRMLNAFVDAGGNFLDTAHVYANWLPGEKSLSEKTLGHWMRERKNRNHILLATKGAHPELSSMHVPRMSHAEVVEDLNESLRYLQVDTIDLYWLHRDDPKRPVGEILELLNEQVREGKIRYFGCSNWKLSRVMEAQDYAEKHSIRSFVASQIMWSLAAPSPDAPVDPTTAAMDGETLEYHKQSGMTVIPYTSQARGFFTKVAAGGPESLKDWVKAVYYNDENLRRLERIKKVSGETGASINTIVLAYLASQPFITIPIVGPQTVQQLEECLEAVDLELAPETVKYLETGEE
jgi:aryl-alcohol dehydrogenase-like predicted oxidoreductase